MKPVFMSTNVYATACKILKEEHLKLTVLQPNCDVKIEAIGFGMADKLDLVASGVPFDMAYTLEVNTWKNKETLQFIIKDIRSAV
jgi:single-stranded-DNA-specific exonuclease